MLAHVLRSVTEAGADDVVVVAGPDQDALIAEAKAVLPSALIAIQTERLGTAHAVLAARSVIASGYDDLLVVFADTPLVKAQTFTLMRGALADRATAVAVLGFEAGDPSGYGRLVLHEGVLNAIREDRDATETERALRLCNAGLMAIEGKGALKLLDAIGAENSQREYYLTDIVGIARAKGLLARAMIVGEDEVQGVNDRSQLAAAEARLQHRLRARAMNGGATLIDPATVTFCFDTELGQDVVVEPHVVFGPGVRVGNGVLIRSFSHIEGAIIGDHATIGPFARLRPGAELGPEVHIGNFVEIKASTIAVGAKINHLSYIGDASVGARTNIGAGVITCNYDGFAKSRTEIGKLAFIGSNSSLVAPVKIGDGAYIGSGSVITKDVGEGALGLARERQIEKPGWAEAFRTNRRK
jgi:bifunctional UDP-N-acetylglucosamine pyrophosphorylase/glucosamine-1-phosphate N-acetyltransferase